MRDMRLGTCALCNHSEVIDAPAVEYTEGQAVRLAVTHAPDSLDFLEPRDPVDYPIGLLRMLVCRACGFVQWFASRPDRIPIDEAYGTRLVKPKKAGGGGASTP
jgi:hypothetical protein